MGIATMAAGSVRPRGYQQALTHLHHTERETEGVVVERMRLYICLAKNFQVTRC